MNENEKDLQQDKIEKNYIEVINDLKENRVDKELYLKAVEENRNLVNALVNGNQKANQDLEKEKINVADLAKDVLYSDKNNNLEYAKKTLMLRKEILEKDGVDIFLPTGKFTEPTQVDIKAAEQCAEYLQECIDNSNDDPKRFQALFESGLAQPPQVAMMRKK